ncbi:MAG TPA: PEP-CTERM sorting domain-containing protein [Gemmatimonadales bacterium]|nr:PEP-CTERM sorting domain-containing protein [Gemmatimonadales bacterium]
MRVRLLVALAGLALALVVQPARAESLGVAVVPDGTYADNVFAALLRQTQDKAESDSTKAPVALLAAAGGALGLAGYFVLSSGDSPVLGGNQINPPGGTFIPSGDDPSKPSVPPQDGGPLGEPGPLGPTLTDPDPTIPGTTTPEPVTMALLATGLASMGGASLVRRRRTR